MRWMDEGWSVGLFGRLDQVSENSDQIRTTACFQSSMRVNIVFTWKFLNQFRNSRSPKKSAADILYFFKLLSNYSYKSDLCLGSSAKNISIFQNPFNSTLAEFLSDPQLEVIFLRNYVF